MAFSVGLIAGHSIGRYDGPADAASLATARNRETAAFPPGAAAGSVSRMNAPVTLCLTTVGSDEDAARIARHLVETGAAACVSIVTPVRSVYTWKGALQDEKEWLLLIKTARGAAELRDLLRAVHPYEVPELLAFPASFADETYARWVAERSGTAPGPEAR